MHGFLIFRDVDVDLSSVNLASVIGRFKNDDRRSNGSGKTAFLQGIKYALFDQVRSKHKMGIVHDGMKNSIVELEFEVKSRKFKVYRSRSSKGTSAAKLWIDGRIAGDKITVVNDTIKHYLGMGPELFDLIYFFSQRDQFGFAQASPSERKSILGKVFKMDMVLKCFESAKSRHKEALSSEQQAEGWLQGVRVRMASHSPRAEHIKAIEVTERDLVSSHVRSSHLEELMADIRDDINDFDQNMQLFSDEIAAKSYEAEEINKQMQLIANKIARTQVESQKQAGQIQGLESQVGQLKESVDESSGYNQGDIELSIKKSRSDILKINNSIAIIEDQDKRCSVKRANIQGQVGISCPTCYQSVGPTHIERIVKQIDSNSCVRSDNLKKLKLSCEKCNIELSGWLLAEKNINASNVARRQLVTSLAHLSTLEKAEAKRVIEIDEYTTQRNELSLKHSEMSAQMSAFNINSVKADLEWTRLGLQAIHNATRNNLKASSNEVVRLSAQLASQESDLNSRIAIEDEHENAIISLKKATVETKVYNYVVDAFSKNGLQAIMIENAIGVIEQFANDILKQMQTRFIVSLKTLKETKAGDQRETLDITVFDNGSERPFENYSGGEQTLINLSLRLALSRIISSLHGIEMQSLFLDEVLAELDEVNREEAVKVVAFLAKSYEQVFVISHTDEIKDLIDSAIVIERYDSHSEVRMTNGRREN